MSKLSDPGIASRAGALPREQPRSCCRRKGRGGRSRRFRSPPPAQNGAEALPFFPEANSPAAGRSSQVGPGEGFRNDFKERQAPRQDPAGAARLAGCAPKAARARPAWQRLRQKQALRATWHRVAKSRHDGARDRFRGRRQWRAGLSLARGPGKGIACCQAIKGPFPGRDGAMPAASAPQPARPRDEAAQGLKLSCKARWRRHSDLLSAHARQGESSAARLQAPSAWHFRAWEPEPAPACLPGPATWRWRRCCTCGSRQSRSRA